MALRRPIWRTRSINQMSDEDRVTTFKRNDYVIITDIGERDYYYRQKDEIIGHMAIVHAYRMYRESYGPPTSDYLMGSIQFVGEKPKPLRRFRRPIHFNSIKLIHVDEIMKETGNYFNSLSRG